ncbi:DUF4148 domain-containing protein [Pseudorhodoferax sp.]|uniref:DUF4148 domain-containing protein n=1 Tax=Pseudorhodoferax sp. TaxID=1993553 RepID=UPI002DD63091|nr:DUF4148 domain-containing protein [Pseudorhodoferax sp.]
MNIQLIAPCVMAAAFIATPCFADDAYASGEVGHIPPVASEQSTLTRDDVVAELQQAQRDGTMPPTAEGADTGAMAAPRPDVLTPQPVMAAR